MNDKERALVKDAVARNEAWPQMPHEDEWENVVSGLGRVATDKRISADPAVPRSAHDRLRWDRIYHGDGLAARIAELLPFDETREWIQVRVESDEMEDEQRTEDPTMDLEERAKVETGVMDALEKLDVQSKIFESRLWARNFGGALLLLGVDDGGGDDPDALAEPLNMKGIRAFTHLTVFDRFEWVPHTWYDNPAEEKFGLPKTYRMGERNVPGGISSAASADSIVHETRFIRFNGTTTSRRRRVMNNGWHDPIWVRLYALVRDFSQAWGGVAAMLMDFRVAVWKMKGLADALKAGDHDAVIERFRIMNLCISISQAVPLDADNEDYEKKSTQLSGLPDTLDRFAEQLSAATGYPISILFGRAPGGLNASGDKDVRQYYDMVRASQKIHLRKPLEQIVELLFLDPDGPTSGKIPDAWSMKFNPLWQLDAKEEAERRERMARADKVYIETGVLTAEEVATSRFGGDEYSIETMLDLKARTAAKEKEEAEPEEADRLPLPGGDDDEDREDNFRRRGPRDWVVVSNEGAIIGRHTTRTSAQSQIGHILESQGVIVERLSATEWIVLNADGEIVGVHTTRRGAASQVDEILGRTDAAGDDVDNVFLAKNEKPVAYYAHSMETYGTEVEEKDIDMLQGLGYEVVNPNDPALAPSEDMEPFLELVRGSDIVFSRGITSGVNYEVNEARKHDIPVVELEGR